MRNKEPRILLILGSNPATVAFANSFVGERPIVGLIQQYEQFPVLRPGSAPGEGQLPFGLTEEEMKSHPQETVLGNKWNALYLDEGLPRMFIKRGEANTKPVLDWVRGLKPDLIVSHGPERLGREFIKTAAHGGVNVHWGLSPTYRGMDTSKWPLIHKQPEWIGLTIHKLDEGLDSGPILYQARPKLIKGYTARMIEYSLTMLACKIVPQAADEVISGQIKPVRQDTSKGTQYWIRQWTKKEEETLTPEYISEQIDDYFREKERRDSRVEIINPWVN